PEVMRRTFSQATHRESLSVQTEGTYDAITEAETEIARRTRRIRRTQNHRKDTEAQNGLTTESFSEGWSNATAGFGTTFPSVNPLDQKIIHCRNRSADVRSNIQT